MKQKPEHTPEKIRIFSLLLALCLAAFPILLFLTHWFPYIAARPELGGSLVRVPVGFIGVALSDSAALYTVLLWLLIATLVVHRLLFEARRRAIDIVIVLSLFFVMAILVLNDAASRIGTDSYSEATRTQITQVFNYCIQFAQTYHNSPKHTIALSLPFFFVVVLLYAAKARLYVPTRSLSFVSCVIAFVCLASCLTLDANSFLKSRTAYSTYRKHLADTTLREAPQFARVRKSPLIFVYIGEATYRNDLYSVFYRNPHIAPYKDSVVSYSDVVSPHSHTFLSLYRVLSLGVDPEADQLTDDRNLHRVNTIDILRSMGISTDWISNKPSFEWIASLFGTHADTLHVQNSKDQPVSPRYFKKDSEVLPLVFNRLATPPGGNRVVFFHSQAGHERYCDFIPSDTPQVNDQFDSLGRGALFGRFRLMSDELQKHDLRCYRSALRYISDNILRSIEATARLDSPAVFIYFADHGQDAMDGTGHDSSRASFRKIEIPLIIYFNRAARKENPDLYRRAYENKDKRYSSNWLSESLIDLAGVTYKRRPLQSIFGSIDGMPSRYSSFRFYGNKYHVISVDGVAAVSKDIAIEPIEFYSMRAFARSLPKSAEQKLCVGHTETLMKFIDTSRIFSCSESDIAVDVETRTVATTAEGGGGRLPLSILLRSAEDTNHRFWFRMNKATPASLSVLYDYLTTANARYDYRMITIDISIDAESTEDNIAQMTRLRKLGVGVSCFVPSEKLQGCAEAQESASCLSARATIVNMIDRSACSEISANLSRGAVKAMNLPVSVPVNVYRSGEADSQRIDLGLLSSSDKYEISYRSLFD